MSTKPAPRCPGCGEEMRLRQYNCDRGAVTAWYACDCGWSSPLGNDENVAYEKAMRRYRPEYDGYQGEPTQPVKIWHAAGGGKENG